MSFKSTITSGHLVVSQRCSGECSWMAALETGVQVLHTRSFGLSVVMWSQWQPSFRPRLSEWQSEVCRLSLLPCVFNVICNLSMTSNHVKALLWAVSTGTRRFHEPNNVKLFIRSSITFNSTQACDPVVQRREHTALGPGVLSSIPVSMSQCTSYFQNLLAIWHVQSLATPCNGISRAATTSSQC